MAILRVKDQNGNWVVIPVIVGKDGQSVTAGPDVVKKLEPGNGVAFAMIDGVLTIGVQQVEDWVFTLEDDTQVTKKVVVV